MGVKTSLGCSVRKRFVKAPYSWEEDGKQISIVWVIVNLTRYVDVEYITERQRAVVVHKGVH
jgi:hypothetical protein